MQNSPTEIKLFEEFPKDKYEIDPSSKISKFILENDIRDGFKVYILNSGSGKQNRVFGEPFGFIKASLSKNIVYLYILPYNFPRLFLLRFHLFLVYLYL